ncbi:hypothetical protein WICPIJ_008186 [Wickerhamomyces pijperi]|uniref:Mannosyltransferase n=1 Tax=Wickerhamomyces pijperi TaxID=599730 RepID=A0A9P8TJ69_WICPI|nr:hypothetical protein WICPIJ_008186 [Wickerhamomyces pijperi]
MSLLTKTLILLLIGSRVLYIFNGIIPDCDETFNYYEPLNFLLRGFGKQTWEYSPEYSIRSYSYLMPFVWLIKPMLWIQPTWTFQSFYLIRMYIAWLNLISVHKLFKSIQRLSKETAVMFLIFSIVNTGESHASINLVPSAVCLSLINLSLSSFYNYQTGRKMVDALNSTLLLGLAGLMGWPFVLVFGLLPMLVIMVQNLGSFKNLFVYVSRSLVILMFIMTFIVGVDYIFYKKLEIVPLNIVLYNVINSSEDAGPNIFGVEPFSYYIKNILLNFNFIGVGAYLAALLIPATHLLIEAESVSNLVAVAQLLLWSVIFGIQPHKEERFLYPVYGLINISAALFCTKIFQLVFFVTRSKLAQRLFRLAVISVIVVLSVLKSVNLSINYSAPLQVYQQIPAEVSGNVCLGREWHRYPSSFFLGETQRLKFLASNFNGLLPGDFNEDVQSLIEATSAIPPNMNNLNQYESDKVISDFVANCEFVIDINQPFDQFDELNVKDLLYHFKLLASHEFLDNERSSGLGKLFWLPAKLKELTGTKLVWHEYKLYQNRHRQL